MLGYIVSQITKGFVKQQPRIVYIFDYKMFHQEASVETIKKGFVWSCHIFNLMSCGILTLFTFNTFKQSVLPSTMYNFK